MKRHFSLVLTLFLLLAGCSPAQLSVMDAADYLYEVYYPQGLPDAQRVDTSEFQGYILSPLQDIGEPGGQQIAWEFCYERIGNSGDYYVFRMYEHIVDDPETGEGHCVTSNFFAVSTQKNGSILMQRTDWPQGLNKDSSKFDEAFDQEMNRWDHFWAVANGEEPLAADDPLKIN